MAKTTLFQISPLFAKKTGIRTKILFPFIVVLVVMACASILVSFNLFSESLNQNLTQQLEQYETTLSQQLALKQTLLTNHLDIVSSLTLARSNRRKTQVNPTKSIIETLLKENGISIYWSANDLGQKRAVYDGMLKLYEEEGTIVKPQRFETEDDYFYSILGMSSYTLNGDLIPFIVEYPIDQSFFSQFIDSDQIEAGILSLNSTSSPATYDVLSATPLLTHLINDSEAFKRFQSALHQQAKTKDPAIASSIRFNNDTYKFHLNMLPKFPGLYTVTLITDKALALTKLKLISITLFFLAVVSIFIFGIYTMIIRKITSTIDILTAVAKKVSKGDLDQHVYVDSGDEIGELSTVFNQMVANLKDSSQSLLDEKNRSEAIIASIPEGIIVTDNENRLIVANQKAEHMFNFSIEKVKGKFLKDYITNDEFNTILDEAFESGHKQIQEEVSVPTQEGKDKIYAVTSSLVGNKKRNIGVITTLRDITHDKELEELRDGFLRTVSHELRTPLTSIIGFIDLIYKGAGFKGLI